MKTLFTSIALIVAATLTAAAQDTIKTTSGLKYVYLEKGDGDQAKKGSDVKLEYNAFKTDGKSFNDGKVKYEVGAGEVIPAWEELLPKMKVGDKVWLYVPGNMGYGKKGMRDPYDDELWLVKPNEDLIYELELLQVK